MRALAERLAETGAAKVLVCCDVERQGTDVFGHALRLIGELGRLPGLESQLLVRSSRPRRMQRRLREEVPISVARRLLGKHHPVRIDDVADIVSIVESYVESLSTAPRPTAAVCSRDADAVELLDCCIATGIAVPKQVGIVGLENHARFYPRSLTTCVPDWDTVGHLLAHTLIGDIPVRRSRRGFVDAGVSIFERGTLKR